MELIPKDFYYPAFALFILSLTLILIPKEHYRKYFWYGLIWGFLFSCAFYLVLGKWLDLFDYRYMGTFSFIDAPLWLDFAWIPSVMIYLYFLPPKEPWYLFPVYLLVFSLTSAALDIVFHNAGLTRYNFWNPCFRFILALIWFWGAKVHFEGTKKAFEVQKK